MSTTVATMLVDIFQLTNEELVRRTEELASDLRIKTCELVESLCEMDRRRLFRDFQCVSLFEYCVTRLRMSEGAAYRRIRAARAFQSYPPVKPLLRDGKLSLESLALLHPYLNDADAGKLLEAASGMRVWEVERLIAGRRTEEPRRDVVRFIAAAPAAPPIRREEPLFETPAAAPLVVPSSPPNPPDKPGRHHVRIAFTADEKFFKLMKEAQAAMRHKYPDGRLDGVFRDALEALLRRKRPWAFPRTKAATS